MTKSKKMLALLPAVALVAASCGGSDSDSEDGGSETADTTAESGSAAPATDGESEPVDQTQSGDLTFYVITHGDGGVFWTVAQNGAEAAGDALGVEVVYQGANNDPEAQAQAIEAAIAAEPDGIAVSLANPDALEGAITQAVDAGIPVYTLNSGLNQYKELGAVTHIGQTETIAGNGAGERFNDLGGTNALCIIQEQGNVGLEERCDGLEETFNGSVTRLNVTGDADIPASTAEVVGALEGDDSIDVILAGGPVQALVAVDAVEQVGRDMPIGNFDLSGDIIDAIEAGQITFAIDQQQYLQGYLPVMFMYLQATNQNTVGGGLPILTGPGFVTADNAAEVRALAEAGTR